MTLCPIEAIILLFHHMDLKLYLPSVGFSNSATEVLLLFLKNMPSEEPFSVLLFAE